MAGCPTGRAGRPSLTRAEKRTALLRIAQGEPKSQIAQDLGRDASTLSHLATRSQAELAALTAAWDRQWVAKLQTLADRAAAHVTDAKLAASSAAQLGILTGIWSDKREQVLARHGSGEKPLGSLTLIQIGERRDALAVQLAVLAAQIEQLQAGSGSNTPLGDGSEPTKNSMVAPSVDVSPPSAKSGLPKIVDPAGEESPAAVRHTPRPPPRGDV